MKTISKTLGIGATALFALLMPRTALADDEGTLILENRDPVHTYSYVIDEEDKEVIISTKDTFGNTLAPNGSIAYRLEEGTWDVKWAGSEWRSLKSKVREDRTTRLQLSLTSNAMVASSIEKGKVADSGTLLEAEPVIAHPPVVVAPPAPVILPAPVVIPHPPVVVQQPPVVIQQPPVVIYRYPPFYDRRSCGPTIIQPPVMIPHPPVVTTPFPGHPPIVTQPNVMIPHPPVVIQPSCPRRSSSWIRFSFDLD